MSTVVVSRGPRQAGPALPQGELDLQEPPALPELQGADVSSVMMYLPMGLGSGAMVLMFANPNAGPMMYIASGLMGVSALGMMFAQFGRSASERKRKLKGERRDYLRYLGQVRKKVRKAMNLQRAAVAWDHPDPASLWPVVLGERLWERRTSHPDFAEVRIGLGAQLAQLRLLAPQTKPVEDLEPLCASALRRFIRAYATVTDVPTALRLSGFSSVELAGDPVHTRGLARAVLAQLVTFHAPEELRIAVLTGPGQAAEWEWAKWLPHCAHPSREDAAGPSRLVATEHDELFELLGPSFGERPAFDPEAAASPTDPFVVVLVDGARIPEHSRLLGGGMRNTVLLEIGDGTGERALRVDVHPERMRIVGAELDTTLGRPDSLSGTRCRALAGLIAPLRTGGAVDVSEPLSTDFDLTKLLGIRDAHGYDVHGLWRSRVKTGKLRVPIGLGEDGSVVELDIKESAQGGMGPHGVLIGATGSGKSELLRTLVIALAVTHSSESLNFVLVDFKGGATFMGMEELPHTSAVITNLADELPLVDRMQDSLHGELIRRQELLRRTGYSSLLEYEKARAGGAELAPLPTLFVVVDEFSELLANKPEFMDLFVMIGRLGRSLGVHLLLASQRLDEGRIHQVESHLSYRVALRTFSSVESRSVIGVSSAYELPSAPGNGFVKTDNTTLVRFKAGYVSGPYRSPNAGRGESAPRLLGHDVVPFSAAASGPGRMVTEVQPDSAVLREESAEDTSLMSVLVGRLRGQGPAARQVWLPPLADAPSLDQVLPAIVPDPRYGLQAVDWPGRGGLRVPVGVVDKPFEQRRDLLLADLVGASGHVGIVGAPQSGKSTLMRTLLLSLALTHTPAEVQFYCLDFGGGTLAALAGLPHVGSVTTRLDRDRVNRTVAELTGLLEARERIFAEHGVDGMPAYRQLRARGGVADAFGDVFLVVDGWFTLRQDFEDLVAAVSELAARGLNYGVHVMITASRWSEVRPSLRDLLGTRFELRLGDPLESEIGTRAAAGVPASPGRGLTTEPLHFLTALPRIDGSASTEELSVVTKALVGQIAEFWPGPSAPPVRMLPARLSVEDLPPPDGDLRVPLGLDELRLEPVVHDFDQVPHLMVFGDGETGKSNLLRVIARAVMQRYSPQQARILLGDFRRDLYPVVPEEYRIGYAVTTDALADLAGNAAHSIRKRLPGPDITPERLKRRDWWSGPRLYVIVDDYDLASGGVGGPLAQFEPLLAQGNYIGLHLIIARSSSGGMRAMMDPVLRRMWELGCPGLLLSYPREEGKFLGNASPRQLPPGRAQFVTRREITLVQTAFAAPPTEEGESS